MQVTIETNVETSNVNSPKEVLIANVQPLPFDDCEQPELRKNPERVRRNEPLMANDYTEKESVKIKVDMPEKKMYVQLKQKELAYGDDGDYSLKKTKPKMTHSQSLNRDDKLMLKMRMIDHGMNKFLKNRKSSQMSAYVTGSLSNLHANAFTIQPAPQHQRPIPKAASENSIKPSGKTTQL